MINLDVTITCKKDEVTAVDQYGNTVHYFKQGGYLKVLFADYKHVMYSIEEGIKWKHSKRGAVSKMFFDWYEEFNRVVYDKYYSLDKRN